MDASMAAVAGVVRLAEEATTEGSVVSPYVFGGTAFAVLLILLVITLMINVDR